MKKLTKLLAIFLLIIMSTNLFACSTYYEIKLGNTILKINDIEYPECYSYQYIDEDLMQMNCIEEIDFYTRIQCNLGIYQGYVWHDGEQYPKEWHALLPNLNMDDENYNYLGRYDEYFTIKYIIQYTKLYDHRLNCVIDSCSFNYNVPGIIENIYYNKEIDCAENKNSLVAELMKNIKPLNYITAESGNFNTQVIEVNYDVELVDFY